MLAWWGIGLAAYLTAPRKADKSSETQHTSATQSATASGGSTIIQVGGNVTIINPGVREETEKAHLRVEAAKLQGELGDKYPLGYVLLGIANGEIVYEPYVKLFRISGDWENWRIWIRNEGIPTVELAMSKVEIDGFKYEDNFVSVPYSDGAAVALPWTFRKDGTVAYPYIEVIDTNQKIFAIGFSDKELNP